MSSVINTNYLSLVAQNNLNSSQSALGTAITRLSSGLRINSAKDDAAGEAIANRFTANVNGLTQAARNANDGISIAQTTEGSLDEINNNLQRVRELTVQAANGTNSASDLESIQAEITQRMAEIDRVSAQTQFNGVKVLASDQTLSIQVGANDNETININLKQINSSTLGLDKLDVTKSVSSTDLKAVTTLQAGKSATWTNFSYSTTGGATYSLAVGSDNKLYAVTGTGTAATYYTATYDADKGTVTVGAATASVSAANINTGATQFDTSKGTVDLSAAKSATVVPPAAPSVSAVYMDNTGGPTATSFSVKAGNTYYAATLDSTTGALSIDMASGTSVAVGTAVTAKAVQTALADPGVAVDLSTVNSSFEGTNSLVQDSKTGSYYVKNTAGSTTTYYAATVDATTGKVSTSADKETIVDPLSSIDKALQTVDSFRSDLGAIQNRFESTITNLNNTVNNLSDARSRIQDADYATEVSNMSRAQILQQAGTSVLAQANQVPQTVLSLLR
ncbi:flagellin [Bordetella sp. N]|uniref:flagellin N-terminal helical domain-containing protein n=1 Tax=Bordetella sp. N TaxID=1746199 RepID=UPI000708CF76|nr:flagellin [Bordetella sp. N]ALM83217.1 flagellin [Bordetella sp. N]